MNMCVCDNLFVERVDKAIKVAISLWESLRM